MDSYHSPTTKIIYKIIQLIWYLLGVLEALLVFRFILKFLGANTTALFTKLMYQITDPLVYPFVSMFTTIKVKSSVFDLEIILAMFVYAIVAFALVRLLLIGKTVSREEAAQKLEKEENNQSSYNQPPFYR